MRSRVPLKIEGIVESFPAKGAEIPLDVAVTFHVTVEKPLETKRLAAQPTLETTGVLFAPGGRKLLYLGLDRDVRGERILDTVAAVDHLDREVGRDSQPLLYQVYSHLQ